ncbi:hypothetical protein C8Q73DRAFT_668775 [Cubamyces lactineus]|nr:hypothetical protein C8Q73DRAFT_668775 [Cubamyces lactineus]
MAKKKEKPISCWQCKKNLFVDNAACQNHASAKNHQWRGPTTTVPKSTKITTPLPSTTSQYIVTPSAQAAGPKDPRQYMFTSSRPETHRLYYRSTMSGIPPEICGICFESGTLQDASHQFTGIAQPSVQMCRVTWRIHASYMLSRPSLAKATTPEGPSESEDDSASVVSYASDFDFCAMSESYGSDCETPALVPKTTSIEHIGNVSSSSDDSLPPACSESEPQNAKSMGETNIVVRPIADMTTTRPPEAARSTDIPAGTHGTHRASVEAPLDPTGSSESIRKDHQHIWAVADYYASSQQLHFRSPDSSNGRANTSSKEWTFVALQILPKGPVQ